MACEVKHKNSSCDMDSTLTTNSTRLQLGNSCRITESLLHKILLGQVREHVLAQMQQDGKRRQTDSEAVARDAVVAAQPAEHGKEQRRPDLDRERHRGRRGGGKTHNSDVPRPRTPGERGPGTDLRQRAAVDHPAYRRTRLLTEEHIELTSDTLPSSTVLLVLEKRAAQPGELKKTPYDQKHLCQPGDTVKFQTLRALRWELHAPVGHSEQHAPTSWLKSPCREKRHAQREGDIAISLDPQGGPGVIEKFSMSQ